MQKPILFSAPMVKVLLNTKMDTWPAEPIDPSRPYKWQTRRIIKPHYRDDEIGFKPRPKTLFISIIDKDGYIVRDESPKYLIGDILWVRETFVKDMNGYYIYRSDPMFDFCRKGDIAWNWTPSLFMPREAARIFLELKAIKIERVNDITEEDAKAEGIDSQLWYTDSDGTEINLAPYTGKMPSPNYRTGFANLWDTINKKRYYGWEASPYVYVYEFMRKDMMK